MDEVWQRSEKSTGGRKPDRGRPGLATVETMRTGESPVEWQVQGSPSGTGTVIVKWNVWWRNAPGQNPRSAARYENGVKDVLRRVFRGCPKGLRQPAKEHQKTPKPTRIRVRSDARQIAVRIRSETLGLRAGISRRPTGFGKLPMIELISCGSHDPSASLSCLATTIAA